MIDLIVSIDETKVNADFVDAMKKEHTELIKCKDCKYYMPPDDFCNAAMCKKNDEFYCYVNEDDFCSFARKA